MNTIVCDNEIFIVNGATLDLVHAIRLISMASKQD